MSRPPRIHDYRHGKEPIGVKLFTPGSGRLWIFISFDELRTVADLLHDRADRLDTERRRHQTTGLPAGSTQKGIP